jgi:hypothetical protein
MVIDRMNAYNDLLPDEFLSCQWVLIKGSGYSPRPRLQGSLIPVGPDLPLVYSILGVYDFDHSGSC